MKTINGSVVLKFNKEHADAVFQEVSEGIYYVVKDIRGEYCDSDFISSSGVMIALDKRRVMVIHRDGNSGFINW